MRATPIVAAVDQEEPVPRATIEQMSKRHLKGRFGSGSGRFELSTVNGSLTIRQS